MNSCLEKRLALLKARIGGEAVTLHMPDGSTRCVRSDARHWRRLHEAWTARVTAEDAGEPETASPLSVELNSIRDAIEIGEDDGGPLSLLRILLQGPNETEEESCPVPIR